MKDKITLYDKATGKSLVLGTEDSFNQNLVLMLPGKNGTLALTEDVDAIKTFLEGDELIASDSLKLGGKTANMYLLSDLSNVDLDNLSAATLSGLKGYTGSKGDVGSGFSISTIFNSVAELLAGTTTEETFALVGGTLSQTDPDYGKLFLRKNNAWNYITDLSIEGAAGITGPQGPIGYTGSRGETGSQGIQGIQGYTGSQGIQGIQGYTGSVGAIIVFVGNNTPSGYLKCNGALLSRTTFSSLWAYAQSSGALVSEIEWSSSNQGCFSTGDGSTTFRIPDLRGEFIRGWDDGRGIDTNRTIGSKQEATSIGSVVQLSHDVILKNTDGTDGTYSVAGDANPQTSFGGTYHKVRPGNIAMMYCIKY